MSSRDGAAGGACRPRRPRDLQLRTSLSMYPHLDAADAPMNTSPSPADLVSLATSCDARHISLRAWAPSYGVWPGAQCAVSPVHPRPLMPGAAAPGVRLQHGFVPAAGNMSIASCIPPPVIGHLYPPAPLANITYEHGLGGTCPSSSFPGGAAMSTALQVPNLAGIHSEGYYQSLLHAFSGTVSPRAEEVLPSESEAFVNSTCPSSSVSPLAADANNFSSGKGNTGCYVEALIDSDDDEFYGGDEDGHCSGDEPEVDDAEQFQNQDVAESEDGVESEDGDATPAPVIEEQDPSLNYDFYRTPVADECCVSAGYKLKKRIRWPKGVDPPDCREPRDIGTIEKAMRNSKNRTGAFIFEPALGMVFDSRAEAYQFFNLYSWEVGFGIRFGTSARNRVNKYRTIQELVCEREGFDHRCTSSSKRNHCKATLRLHPARQ